MRAHDHDVDGAESLRPKASRLDEAERALTARAAAAGRWDAVGAAGLDQLQRSVGNAGGAAALADEERSRVHDVGASGGRPVAADVRTDMDGRLGHAFGDVRVHDDVRAHDSAVAVNAHAYTFGSNVVFRRDRYDAGSHDGRVTLAHELTHVAQQRSGPVDGAPADGGIQVSDPGDRFEREVAATAERAMAAPVSPAPAAPAVQPESAGVAVQREGEEDEEAMQRSVGDTSVQREGEDEMEEPTG
jgi:hypothetical protein